MKKRRISWKVLKENWSFVAEDIFLTVFIGFFYIGIVSIFSDGDNLSASVKDVTPLFIGLVSVYVAFSVLSMSLEANRKQSKIDRSLTVRPLVQIEKFRVHDNWGKLPSIILKFVDGGNGIYDGAFDEIESNSQPVVLYNSGLGPCYGVTLVVDIGGKLMQGINVINEIVEKDRKAVNIIYTKLVKESGCIYTVCKDIYGNHHVVANFFHLDGDIVKFFLSKYIGGDNESGGDDEASNIIEFAKKDGMYIVH